MPSRLEREISRLYLSDVPDMKSPLSDILILAPLSCKEENHGVGEEPEKISEIKI